MKTILLDRVAMDALRSKYHPGSWLLGNIITAAGLLDAYGFS